MNARLARSHHRLTFDGTDGDVVRLPDAAGNELVNALASTVTRRLCQIVPVSTQSGGSNSFSHLVWRKLAERDVAVQRLYLVPPGQANVDLVAAEMRADERSRARSRRLDMGECGRWSQVPLDDVPLTELWLIDGQAVVIRELSADGPPVWVVSVREKDIRRAQQLWDGLWDAPEMSGNASGQPVDLTEPLLESAPMMHTMAPMSCTRDHVDRSSCSWYHGIWQYLRLFDMVSSPGWHSGFYTERLRRGFGEPGRRRVLITGAADYSMLAYVIAAAQETDKLASNEFEAHVLDLCRTPLNACRWYGDRFNVPVKLHELDILADGDELARAVGRPSESGSEAGFDFIVTDAFLSRFSGDELGRVLDNWRALLRPGGRVITTIRLHPRDQRPGRAARGGPPQEALDYTLRLRQRALSLRTILHIDLNNLIDAGREYALKMTSTDLGELADVVALLHQHGFVVTYRQEQRVVGELVPSYYARLELARIDDNDHVLQGLRRQE